MALSALSSCQGRAEINGSIYTALTMEFSMSRNWFVIRVWFVVLVLVASLAGAPAFAQGAATVRVDPSTLTVQLNNTASLGIKVDNCLLYTSDAADERSSVDLGGRR